MLGEPEGLGVGDAVGAIEGDTLGDHDGLDVGFAVTSTCSTLSELPTIWRNRLSSTLPRDNFCDR